MARSQIIHGSADELFPYLEKFHDRPGLTLIVPEEPGESDQPTAAEIEEANARLRRHIVTISPSPNLDNSQIDADLAQAYGESHDCDSRVSRES